MAQKTLSLDAQLQDRFTITSDVRGHQMTIDQTARGGGADLGPSPLEYQLLALGGCLITIAKIVAHQRRIALRAMRVRVEGDLDSDVLLGRRDDLRAGFTTFRVHVDLDADLTDEEKVDFMHEVDRRCPISENLLHATPVEIAVAESEVAA